MKRRILVVDDEAIVANDVSECLTHMGCEVIGHALSGPDAIARAEAGRPDLIMMDITLQGPMDGVEAAIIIRERFDIPCIFLTAYSDSSVLARAKKAAPAGYMVKPFEEAGLRSAVEVALYKVDLERTLSEHREWLQTTLLSVSDGVIATHSNGLVRLMNPVAEKLTGWANADAAGRPIDEVLVIFDENERVKAPNLVHRALYERNTHTVDRGRMIMHRNGLFKPIAETASPTFTKHGVLNGAVLTLRDTTQQRAVQMAHEQENQRLEELVTVRTTEIRKTNLQLTAEVEERRRAQAAVARQVLVEQFIAGLSAFFLQSREEDAEAQMRQALEKLGSFLKVDRCYLVVRAPEGLLTTLEWCAQHIPPVPGSARLVTVEHLPEPSVDHSTHMEWLVSEGGTGRVPGVGDVSAHIAAQRGARSVLWVQPSGQEHLLAYAGADSVSQHREFGPDEMRCLSLAVTILATQMERNAAAAEKQRLHAQLQQSLKMEAVGNLSGGIAHDFNNMLLPIIGFSDMVLQRLHPDDPSTVEISEIKKAAERAAGLTRQLLAFSRKQVAKKTVFDLNESITSMTRMLGRVIGEGIALKITLSSAPVMMLADQGQLEQVIVNLIVNARDAIGSHGGNLGSIAVRTLMVDAAQHAVPVIGGIARAGHYAVLSISDTGAGIPLEIQERIFEPFFTTKGTNGTGLGLSVIYGIIQDHQGGLQLDSAPGRGASFHIFLPATPPSAAGEKPVSTPSVVKQGDYRGRGQRVLLVEDEEAVSRLVRTALSQNGYVVTTAHNATEAVERFREAQGQFEMVFSDVVLPDGNGLQLLDTFLTTNPHMRALLSSGYTDKTSLLQMARQRKISFLPKPYSLNALFQTVAEVMADQNTHLLS